MKLSTKELVICALFASITSILSQISIPLPFTTVPVTLQIFAVALCGVILGPKLGFMSQIAYIFTGAIGIPVFAQMSGGIGIILGPTGGFILAFPIMTIIIGYFSKKSKSTFITMVGMIIALLFGYTIGTIQFVLITKMTFIQGIMACVAPFIVFDIIKISLATVVGIGLEKRINLGVKSC